MGISYLSDEHLETITKHTRGFRYFSVTYIEVKKNPFEEPQATVHAIFKSSVLFVSWTSKCKSVWPVDMYPFLLTRYTPVVYLTL